MPAHWKDFGNPLERLLAPHNAQGLKLCRIHFILCGDLLTKPNIITDPDQFLTVIYSNVEGGRPKVISMAWDTNSELKIQGAESGNRGSWQKLDKQ